MYFIPSISSPASSSSSLRLLVSTCNHVASISTLSSWQDNDKMYFSNKTAEKIPTCFFFFFFKPANVLSSPSETGNLIKIKIHELQCVYSTLKDIQENCNGVMNPCHFWFLYLTSFQFSQPNFPQNHRQGLELQPSSSSSF